MADDDQAGEQENGAEQASGSKKKLIIFIVLALLLLGGVGGGTTYFLLMGEDKAAVTETDETQESETSSTKEAFYFELEEPFIVDFNVGGRQRYLQLYITIMAREQEPLKVLETHLPLIRNNLNLVIGQQDFDALASNEGKQKLKDEALASVKQIMAMETGSESVEAILFTNFVMQ
ncbi:flagellar basal body-associated FliL family protein [Aestuariirhabdus sp. Z084]|uniref:flagellar basal body-associated FliL family protein n=1 Tax=Aestuariirhabdus haliotis TaxID=2918751 RepID=UPI00201B45A1|nr:flagellar basal body-associated FliL family protein [Aestuariirhabdus haliotis]MCL6414467.1 flagellar basal body-associated FliL family protein [Aestuariirhabdus haliotis]MCL6418551.1 flagellar basal body-associated FliL family protein [Aestuariirhabdus haliotis]